MEIAPQPPKGHGAFNEWAYYHFGRWSLSVPAWIVPTIEDEADTTKKKSGAPAEKKKDPIARERNLYRWLTTNGLDDSFVEWQKVSHPDFPGQLVEIGGFAPYLEINPPVDSLAALAQRHSRYLTWLSQQLARIELDEPKVEKLGGNVSRITVHAKNTGFLPTNSDMGVKVQWPRKVKVDISLANGQKLSSGRKMILIDTIPGSGGVKEISWVVTGKKGKVKIRAGSPMVGFAEKEIEL